MGYRTHVRVKAEISGLMGKVRVIIVVIPRGSEIWTSLTWYAGLALDLSQLFVNDIMDLRK